MLPSHILTLAPYSNEHGQIIRYTAVVLQTPDDTAVGRVELWLTKVKNIKAAEKKFQANVEKLVKKYPDLRICMIDTPTEIQACPEGCGEYLDVVITTDEYIEEHEEAEKNAAKLLKNVKAIQTTPNKPKNKKKK